VKLLKSKAENKIFLSYPSYALKCGITFIPISNNSSFVIVSCIPEPTLQATAHCLKNIHSKKFIVAAALSILPERSFKS
jgi:hypothetical protein